MRYGLLGCAVWLLAAPVQANDAQEAVTSEASQSGVDAPLTLQLQGGIEGYTGHLAPRIDPGVTYGLSLAYDPSRYLGVELGYSGALNEIRPGPFGVEDVNPSGPDLIRNGAYVIITPGVTFHLPSDPTTTFKPYALGGLGVDRYWLRGIATRVGFRNSTVPNVPFGAGLRARVGHLSADARVAAAWEFDQRFSDDPNPLRVQGQVLLGASF